MVRFGRLTLLIFVLFTGLSSQPSGQQQSSASASRPTQEETGWRISPEKINIQVGDDRSLQLLDDLAQEITNGLWSIDPSDLGDIEPGEHGRAVVHAKAIGTVRVTATVGMETRFRDIVIWPAENPIPPGTTNWGVRPIGRELGDIPAVPTDDGPNMFSLEQTAAGGNYLRAGRDDGIQVWSWVVPEPTRNVELGCGDWLGGAVISANRADSYTIYAVAGDGTMRWKYEARGSRTGLAISTAHLIHLVSQSADGTSARVAGLDEESGALIYDLPIPESIESHSNVRVGSATFACAPGSVSKLLPTIVTRPIVHIDGHGYIAFTQRSTVIAADGTCVPGATLSAAETSVTLDERVVLWQIHADGTYRTTVVEALSGKQSGSSPVTTLSPTRSITPNVMNGVLIPVQLSRRGSWLSLNQEVEDLVLGLNGPGTVLYKVPMPRYSGRLHDEMVLGESDTAFATRGGILIAFNQRTGRELWRWDSKTPEIEVFAALANGHCAIQTPTALVEVEDNVRSKELLKGKAMMDWLGHMYIKR
jgi:outer membrane protein assembly factor BamB